MIALSPDDVLEKYRKASDDVIELRLQIAACETDVKYVEDAARWGALLACGWMLFRITNPARFAWLYPNSWDYKLINLTDLYPMAIGYFLVAGLLLVPLMLVLLLNPAHHMKSKLQDYAMVGMALGAIGHAYLASFALKLDLPDAVDNYLVNTIVLSSAAFLLVNWHNTCVKRKKIGPHSPQDAGCVAGP